MSEPENFLTRWSRRKQEAGRAVEAPDDTPGDERLREAPAAEAPAAASKPAGEKQEEAFDLSSLPPLESIGAGTDIRAFLQKGVPLELSRAALRRAWVSDPAIRDFIEVAENQWDFATGSDIAGFGPLEASEEVRRMVAEMFHGPSKVTPVERTPAGDGVPSLAEQQNLQEPARVEAVEEREPQKLSEAEASPTQDVVQREENNTATQQERQYSDSCAPAKRTHGRALPQ